MINITVMGDFNSGKSSLINAIAGEDLLPVKMLPPTFPRVILHYSERENVVINFDLSASEIKKQSFDMSLIDFEKHLGEYYWEQYMSNSKSHIDSYSPSPFLKGIEIYKCGICDYDLYGRSGNVILKSDIVIYVIDSKYAFKSTDRETLGRINAAGYDKIIFAFTFWDIIGSEEGKKVKEFCLKSALKHTSLGEEAIFFLDSKSGLKANRENDEEMLKESGYADFEEYLTNYYIKVRNGKESQDYED